MFSLYDDEQIFNAAMREHAKTAAPKAAWKA